MKPRMADSPMPSVQLSSPGRRSVPTGRLPLTGETSPAAEVLAVAAAEVAEVAALAALLLAGAAAEVV